MKKIVTLAIAASALLAGPDIDSIVDYDAQDNYVAKVQEARQFIPTPVVAPIVTPPVIQNNYQQKSVEGMACCSNRDSVDLLLGYDLTDGTFLDDAGTLGIRYNKNIAPNTYIQAGYERVLYSKYSNKNNRIKATRANQRTVIVDPDSANSLTGDASGADSSNDGSSTTDSQSDSLSNIASANGAAIAGTQLDRFYLNGMYEFCDEYKLMPYVFGGLGYENVRHESEDLQSGGFANLGGGVKYQLNEDLNLITEAKALKKFDNGDLDILGAIGLGFMFGEAHVQQAPSSEFSDRSVAPKHVSSILPAGSLNAQTAQVKSYQPKQYATQTTIAHQATPAYQTVPTYQAAPAFQTKKINFAQKDRTNYDRYDVVAIETERSYKKSKGTCCPKIANTTRASHRQKYDTSTVSLANSYDNLSYATTGEAYYIQVAALFQGNVSDKRYFQRLNEEGLNHKIKHTTVRGRPVQLVLVGPYRSRTQAENDLKFAKRVESGAFIKKI